MGKETYLDEKAITEQLKVQLREHRKKLGLPQWRVAQQTGNAEKTYQHWESTGEGLSNMFTILKLFQVLGFSTAEIIDVLGLPPLTLNDIGTIWQDEGTLKRIKEDGIYPYVRMNCGTMDCVTIEKLLDVLTAERLRRRKYPG